MKDRFFYPLAALMIGGIIYYALSFSVAERPVDPNIYELSGADLSALFPSPGTTMQLANDSSGAVAYAVLGAHLARVDAPPSAGVFGTLGAVHERNFAGHPIRITLRARQGQFSKSTRFEMGYFTAGAGDSEWATFYVGTEFSDFSFVFTPAEAPLGGTDFIGIWPDESGAKGTIDVLSVRVEKIVEIGLRGASSGN